MGIVYAVINFNVSEVGIGQVCILEIHIPHLSASKVRTLKVGFSERYIVKNYSITEDCLLELRESERTADGRARKVRTLQLCACEVSIQLRSSKVSSPKIYASMELRVIFEDVSKIYVFGCVQSEYPLLLPPSPLSISIF